MKKKLPKEAEPVRGLKNLGNTCFLNAVLQNLAATGPLREHFSTPAADDREGPTTRAMRKFLASLQTGTGTVSPSELLKAVSARHRRFAGRSQQDSQEVLRQLLEAIRTEEVARLSPPATDDSPKPAKEKKKGRFLLTGSMGRTQRAAAAAIAAETNAVEANAAGSTSDRPSDRCEDSSSPPLSYAEAANPSPETMRVMDFNDDSESSPNVSPSGKRIVTNPYAEDDDDASVDKEGKQPPTKKDPDTFVDEVFGGELRSCVVCLSCGTVSTCHEPFLDLSLSMPTRVDSPPSPVSKEATLAEIHLDEEGADRRSGGEAYRKGKEKEKDKEPPAKLSKKDRKTLRRLTNKRRGKDQNNATDEEEEVEHPPASAIGALRVSDAESIPASDLTHDVINEPMEVLDVSPEETDSIPTPRPNIQPTSSPSSSTSASPAASLKKVMTPPTYAAMASHKPTAGAAAGQSPPATGTRVEVALRALTPTARSTSARRVLTLRFSVRRVLPRGSVADVDVLARSLSSLAVGAEWQPYQEVGIKASRNAVLRSLPLEQTSPPAEGGLASCFQSFVAPELLEGDCCYHCESCEKREKVNKMQPAVKWMQVGRAPRVLTLHLKRFRHSTVGNRSSMEKVNGWVAFPTELDLRPYCAATSSPPKHVRELTVARDAPPLRMNLIGVVEHSGSFTGGHYTAYVRSTSDERKWFYCSDTHVTEATEHAVLAAQAFLLFYTAIP